MGGGEELSNVMKTHIMKNMVPQTLIDAAIMQNHASASFLELKDWVQTKAKDLASQHFLTSKSR